MRNDQMARALGVREADIGRQYGAAGQELAGRLGQYGLGAGLAESGLGREYGAAGQELAQRYGQFGNAAQGQEGVYQRQMQALGLMPTMETSDANIARQLFGLGEMSRTLDQQQLEGEIGRWNQNVRQPMDVLDWARTGLMSMSGPGNTVSQSSQPGSPVAGALGGGALGAYVGRQPWFQELFSPNPVPYTPVPYTGFGSGGSPGYDPFNVNP